MRTLRKIGKLPVALTVIVIGLALAFALSRPRIQAQSGAPEINLPPQIEFVSVLRSAADVNPKPGFFKKMLKKIAGLDDRDKTMLTPQGIAVDDQGRILVADTKERVLHVFDINKQTYKKFHPPDSDPFLAPIAVAVDAQDRIYVSDALRSRVFRFNSDGKYLGALGAIDKKESIFKRCTGIAIDRGRERLYVVDTVADQIVTLDLSGKVLRRIGARGNGPGEFNYPTHITVADDGSLWVMDSLNFRVQHLDSDGNVLSSFGRLGDSIGEFDKAKGVALDRQGHVYVVEGRFDRVQVFDPESGRLLFFFGQTGNNLGEFLPTGIAVDKDNKIYVADGYNRRVQIFHLRNNSEAAGMPGGH